MVQSYRNTRKGFYTDCYQDTTPIGSIVPNLKSGENSYDHYFVWCETDVVGLLSLSCTYHRRYQRTK